jgi:hypothetical protein
MDTTPARSLIAGGFASFMFYLISSSNPIIIGGGYPTAKFIDAYQEWAKLSEFDTSIADLNVWREACKSGFLKGKL